jgi:RimJ/RimL family protein N-acetyltransferase
MIELQETSLAEIDGLLLEADAEFVKSREEAGTSIGELLRGWAKQGRAAAFACLVDGRVAGFITARLDEDPQALVIGPMYVRPGFRGRAAGTEQVRLLLEWAVERGVARARTRTWSRNRASRRIFEKLGFAAVEEVPAHRVDGDSTIYYEWHRPDG